MSKQAAKCELQKLKSLTDTTEVWSRRVHKFWKSTADVCLAAAESFHADTASVSQLKTQLSDYSESACKCVENVKEVAQHRFIELSRSFQEKSKSKHRDSCCKEVGRKVEAASVEISSAVFATFQNQADQLDLLLQEVMSFRDLAAVANVVDKMGQSPSRESDEIQKLKKQLKQAQRENGDLMRRSILAEHALGNSERCNSELMECIDAGYSHDDFLEVRKALKQEQIARLDAEQRLKDAQEEIKAAQFAYKVAKAVANRIADSAEITQGGLLRCQSERQILEVSHQLPHAVSVGIPDQTTASESDQELHQEVPVIRTDSAYFSDGHDQIPSSDVHPQTPSQESLPPIYDLPEEPNPFMEDSKEADNPFLDFKPTDDSNPFLEADDSNPFLEADDSNPFLDPEDGSNPFLTGGEEEQVSEKKEDELEQSPFDDTSNPFLTPEIKSDSISASEWNPFLASESSNPFLS